MNGKIEIIGPDGRSRPAERRRGRGVLRPYSGAHAASLGRPEATPAERRRHARLLADEVLGDRLDLEV